jgi:hypothetical protein
MAPRVRSMMGKKNTIHKFTLRVSSLESLAAIQRGQTRTVFP